MCLFGDDQFCLKNIFQFLSGIVGGCWWLGGHSFFVSLISFKEMFWIVLAYLSTAGQVAHTITDCLDVGYRSIGSALVTEF